MTAALTRLSPGMPIPYGGDKLAVVDEALAAAFAPGDRLIVVQEDGALLRVPAAVHAQTAAAVDAACAALAGLAAVSDAAISAFFADFAARLADEATWKAIAEANAADVEAATAAGRATGRLVADEAMRADMIAGLRAWADAPPGRGRPVESVDHGNWRVDLVTAPLGVIGFVFEGRPNVFADAAGVIRSGNVAVFRIGSDALRTARAIAGRALSPALAAAGLPAGAAVLLDQADRAAGLALFSDPRLALAVARGSGPAVTQLGAVARQSGIPASLHGTGGAWLVAAPDADAARFAATVMRSLDRKVCNTLNVCCIVRARAADLVPAFLGAVRAAGARRGQTAVVHAAAGSLAGADVSGLEIRPPADEGLGREWEWDTRPELSLALVDSVDEAVDLFNRHSPRFVASLISPDAEAQARFFARIEAPFVGDGFTRWVDGQYAVGRPELGLSNWQTGRPFARGGILSGDGVFTVRARMRQVDPDVKR